jgi:hypothetical protein
MSLKSNHPLAVRLLLFVLAKKILCYSTSGFRPLYTIDKNKYPGEGNIARVTNRGQTAKSNRGYSNAHGKLFH